ncbi:MAG: hypothetical protein SFV18_17590 [Bryobacteraceae bacterium]|nr:hypothetical protein [Bryobacteraceae bacterium]
MTLRDEFPQAETPPDDGYIYLCTCGHPHKRHEKGCGGCFGNEETPIGRVYCDCKKFQLKRRKR